MHEPIFLFCLVGTVSVFTLICLIQYEPRQANVCYPLGMPLVVVFMEWIAGIRVRYLIPHALGYASLTEHAAQRGGGAEKHSAALRSTRR